MDSNRASDDPPMTSAAPVSPSCPRRTVSLPPADLRGFSLLEMVVVIAIVALGATVVAVGWRRPSPQTNAPAEAAALAEARTRAVLSGEIVTVQLLHAGRPATVSALPDGRIVGDADVAVDPLSGRPSAVRDNP